MSLEGFVGRYFSRELELWANVGLEESEDEDGNHLVLQHLRMKPIDLTHRSSLVPSRSLRSTSSKRPMGTSPGSLLGTGVQKGSCSSDIEIAASTAWSHLGAYD